MTNTENELLNCPFCNKLDEIRVKENTTPPAMNRAPNVISCDITHWCGAHGLPRLAIKVTGRDKQDAIKAWNTRATNPDLAKKLAEVEGYLTSTKDNIKTWGNYASPYFQEKWNLEGDIADIEKALTLLSEIKQMVGV